MQRAICLLFNILNSIIPFHSPGGTGPQYLNNWLNRRFAFGTFKNSMPTLDRDTQVKMWGPVYDSSSCTLKTTTNYQIQYEGEYRGLLMHDCVKTNRVMFVS